MKKSQRLLSLLLAGLILLAWHEEPKQGTSLSLEISSGSSKSDSHRGRSPSKPA